MPSIASSARRHGIDDKEMLHAFNNPILVEYLDDGLVMFVGADTAGNLLEIGVADTPTGPLVVHAMPARLRYMRGNR